MPSANITAPASDGLIVTRLVKNQLIEGTNPNDPT
jgi:hypothetical protein